MYQQYIASPDQALVHLAFHCCLKDGTLQDEELDTIANTFASKGLNKSLSLKDEMLHYQSYFKEPINESGYLDFLIETIAPKNKLALFAFCAEIIYRDGRVAISEEVLLNRLAALLYINENESTAVQNLISEMNDVEKRGAF